MAVAVAADSEVGVVQVAEEAAPDVGNPTGVELINSALVSYNFSHNS